MDSISNILRIARYNIKILANLNILAVLALIIGIQCFYGLNSLSYQEMAGIGELILSIIGIILFSYIENIEEEYNIQELIYNKKTPHIYIFVLRLIIMMLISLLLVGAVVGLAKFQGGEFPFGRIVIGIWISAVFLGMIALTVTTFTHEIMSGYLVSFAYYIFEFITKGNYTKEFYVFSLLNKSFHEKYNVLSLAVLMLILNFIYIYRKTNQ